MLPQPNHKEKSPLEKLHFIIEKRTVNGARLLFGVSRRAIFDWQRGAIPKKRIDEISQVFDQCRTVVHLPSLVTSPALHPQVHSEPRESFTPAVSDIHRQAEIVEARAAVQRAEKKLAEQPDDDAPRNLALCLIGLGALEGTIGGAGLADAYGYAGAIAFSCSAGVAAFMIGLSVALGRQFRAIRIDQWRYASTAWSLVLTACFSSLVAVLVMLQGGWMGGGMTQAHGLETITAVSTGNALFPLYVVMLAISSVASIRLNYRAAGPAAKLERAKKHLRALELKGEKG